MLRLFLALLFVTKTASAALPFELPPLAIPAPTIPQLRNIETGADMSAKPFKLPPLEHSFLHFDLSGLPVCEILRLIELFGSAERYRTALDATRVEAVRISSSSTLATNSDGYIESEPIALVGWQADILQRTLTPDSTYIWDTELTERAECIPTYEIRIRLIQGNTVLTAELSFSSRMIRILEGNSFISEHPLTERGFARLLFLEPR